MVASSDARSHMGAKAGRSKVLWCDKPVHHGSFTPISCSSVSLPM